MSTTQPSDVAGDARIAHNAHQQMVETVMGIIDLLDLAERGEARPDVAELRKKIGEGMRRSIVDHSAALAALVLDREPAYAEHLVTYAQPFAETLRTPLEPEQRHRQERDPIGCAVVEQLHDAYERLVDALNDQMNRAGALIDVDMAELLTDADCISQTDRLKAARRDVRLAQAVWSAAAAQADALLERRAGL